MELIKAFDSVVLATSSTIDDIKLKTLAPSGRKKFYNQGYKGAGINICIIDTGVNSHEEFGSRLLVDKSKNFCRTGSYSPNYFGDDHGHGTHVASLAAGKKCGIAPEANIISYKVINGMGECSDVDIVAALDYIYQEGYKDIDIVNMSLGGSKSPLVITGIYETAIKRVVVDRGIPIMVAAGNTGVESIHYPAHFQDVIAVGALNYDKTTAHFSTRSSEIDIAQIGVDIWGADFKGGYVQKSGTSMASPYAAGLGALLLCKYKKMFGKRMPEPVFYEMVKLNTVDISTAGIDKETGAGLFTLGDGVTVDFISGSNLRTVNGKTTNMDVPVILQNERNYLPARHVAEPGNAEVIWDPAVANKFTIIY